MTLAVDNRSVGLTALRTFAIACALCVPTAMIGDDLIRLALSVEAHKCCAATGGECAQLSAPDDCCKTQQEGSTQSASSVAPGARHSLTAAVPALATALPIASGMAAPSFDGRMESWDIFKRPHDPPHLHPFPLLI